MGRPRCQLKGQGSVPGSSGPSRSMPRFGLPPWATVSNTGGSKQCRFFFYSIPTTLRRSNMRAEIFNRLKAKEGRAVCEEEPVPCEADSKLSQETDQKAANRNREDQFVFTSRVNLKVRAVFFQRF